MYLFRLAEISGAYGQPSAGIADVRDFLQLAAAHMARIHDQGTAPVARMVAFGHGKAQMPLATDGLTARLAFFHLQTP